MKSSLFKIILSVLILVQNSAICQAPHQKNSSEIFLELKKLDVLANVLYLAAHPDDENTRLIGYLSREKLYNAAYLALTRGDGGQNLVGPDIRELLGIIRTQELLAARRIDGSQQFFTRANDFGYSKSADETLKIWDKDQVLSDVVWVIRNFRPDVIITRFPPDARAGHGHHTVSAMMAEQAFDIVNDKSAYPDQLKYVAPWQPTRLLWNTGRFWNRDMKDSDPGVVTVDVGTYNPLLGTSYTEMAAVSRSFHKSQGFGSSGSRGETMEYLISKKGTPANQDIMEGIDTSWNRVKGGNKIQPLVEKAIADYDLTNPGKSVPQLIEIRKAVNQLDASYWKDKKLKEVDNLIKDCLGLFLELRAQDPMLTAGDSINVTAEVVNRADQKVNWTGLNIPSINISENFDKPLENNQENGDNVASIIPASLPITQPYWLKKEGTLGMYRVDDQKMIGKAENDPAITGDFTVSILGEEITYHEPVIYKWTDPVKGEQYRSLSITPPAFVEMTKKVLMFPNTEPKEVEVKVKSGRKQISGDVFLQVPKQWKVVPEKHSFTMKSKGEEQSFTFQILPPENQEVAEVKPLVKLSDGTESTKALTVLDYAHIPMQVLFPESSSKIVRVELQKRGERIGYIMGAGDEIPESLEQIGYTVWRMNDDEVTPENLASLDAVILGVRALNTNDRIRFQMPALLDYAKQGGTLIVQYNNNYRMKTDEFAPYDLHLSRDRVAEEDAKVEILDPDSPVLSSPNKITEKDFEGWVQERGLYFPDKWADQYDAVLSSHDTGETPKNGGLLVAKYGKGYYVYTGYSWFRELPAGVPGAFRLFTNLISLGQEKLPDNVKVRPEQKN